MRDVTLFRHEDWHAGIIPWADRDNPTEAELNPEWARIIIHTIFTHDQVDALVGQTKDHISKALSWMVP